MLSPRVRMKVDARIREAIEDGGTVAIHKDEFESYPRLYEFVGEAVVNGAGVARQDDAIVVMPKRFVMVDKEYRYAGVINVLTGLALILRGLFGRVKSVLSVFSRSAE